jgi:hypothetical protein
MLRTKIYTNFLMSYFELFILNSQMCNEKIQEIGNDHSQYIKES